MVYRSFMGVKNMVPQKFISGLKCRKFTRKNTRKTNNEIAFGKVYSNEMNIISRNVHHPMYAKKGNDLCIVHIV